MTVSEIAPMVANPIEAYNDTLREVFFQILSRKEYPLSARLFSMAGFAFEADAFMYPESRDFSEDRLAQEVDPVAGRVYEELWISEFADKSPDLKLPMSVIQTLLLARARNCAPEFKETIVSAWARYAPESEKGGTFLDVVLSEETALVQCSAMAERYKKRRDRLYAVSGSRIDERSTDFCLKFLSGRDLMDAPTMLAYVQELVLNLMLIKFFLASDPALAENPRKNADHSADERISTVIGRLERHLSEERESMTRLVNMLAEQGMQDLSHTCLLISF